VAGLQAIATCRRLGAVVRAYDVRAAVREQVESLGAKFLEIELGPGDAEDEGGYARELGEDFYRRQREMMLGAVAESDVVITTAAVPGRKAPVLVTEEMIRGMRAGSVIVDLAAERGGNCELTSPGETVVRQGVTILGPVNLPATVPMHASQMYARNVLNFASLVVEDGTLVPNLEDEVVAGTTACRGGAVVHTGILEALAAASSGA
jgi:NAD(P) transhydrogenase subunit alpha